MKKVLTLISVIVLFLNSGFAQGGKYIPNPNLDRFVGTWFYEDNQKVLTVILSKAKVTSHEVTIDVLQGFHILKVGNKTIENSTEPTLKMGTSFSEDGINHTDQINLAFLDPTKKKGGRVTLLAIPNKPNEIEWILANTQGMRIHRKGEKEFDKTFTLPTHLTLKKQL